MLARRPWAAVSTLPCEVNVDLNRRQFIEVASAAVALPHLQGQAPKNEQDDPLGVRRDFPVVREGLYLNSAYIAPVPVAVADAARVFAERKVSKPIPLDEMLKKTDEVRGQFARLVGAEPDEIGFLFATSEGENIVASALDLKAGDNVVVDELHYNTTFVLYRHLEQTRGIALRIVKHRDGRVTTEDFARAVDDRTRLLSVAWVSHQNGFRHDMRPLADLAHAHGAVFYTDAVQALGMFPASVRATGIDCMTSGTYKWLLGGFGVAPFFVRRELLDRIRVDRLGALHVEKELGDHRYEIYRTAKKFEYATLPFAEIYQLGVALSYLERVGVDRIERHTVGLARELRDGLAALGLHMLTPTDNGSSIVSVELGQNGARAREVLDKNGVQVSFREKGSQIRVSPALFNTRDEIRRFLDLAKSFA
jgi:selenocysteine lyase/cysteine desulfurase